MRYTLHPTSDRPPYFLDSDIRLGHNDMMDIVLPHETISLVVAEISRTEPLSYCDYCWMGRSRNCLEIKWLRGNASLCQRLPRDCIFMEPSSIMEEL
jgi:hypothetical protein